MAENAELEDLDQLVNSPGWRRFTEMVNDQWSASSAWFLGELDKTLQDDGQHSREHFRQVRASQREIQKVLALVPERIKLLKQPAQAQTVPMSRRGGL